MLFIVIMVRIYTLPLFAVRPMYLTMRAFKKAFNDVILSRRAIHNMNTWYPDATPEELSATDNVSVTLHSLNRILIYSAVKLNQSGNDKHNIISFTL